MTPQDLWIVGTRSFAGELADLAEDAGFNVRGLLEPYDRKQIGATIHGLEVRWMEGTAEGLALIGTGERERESIVRRTLAAGWTLAAIVHPRAHVSRRSAVGHGAVIGPGVVIGAHTTIGEHAVLGRGVLVGHHTEIGSFATLNPGANIAGNVQIGVGTFVGMSAAVRDHVRVGDSALVASGAVVVRDVPPGAEVYGLPARIRQPLDASQEDLCDTPDSVAQ